MDLALSFRFEVTFLDGGQTRKVDTRFQRVSGISVDVKTTTIVEGGENLYSHRLPERIEYGNLTLERGLLLDSDLNTQFDDVMKSFKFTTSDVLVTLLGADENPVAAWLFIKAYPVRWSTSDLDANDEKVVIDTIELAYSRMQVIRS